jgi:hypothetical protein
MKTQQSQFEAIKPIPLDHFGEAGGHPARDGTGAGEFKLSESF